MSIAAAGPECQTLRNLQTAYEGETNASIKYTAFAIKSEVDGFARVAALFRAAARAEQVHATQHARVIAKMGNTPHATIHPPEVKSTRENLETAKAGEEYERDIMYPNFIEEAETRGFEGAVRTFTLALKAETVHAQLYGEALANMEAQRAQTIFFVCPICGEVTDKQAETDQCRICKSRLSLFQMEIGFL